MEFLPLLLCVCLFGRFVSVVVVAGFCHGFVVVVVACLFDLLVCRFVLIMTSALLKLGLSNRVVLSADFFFFLIYK